MKAIFVEFYKTRRRYLWVVVGGLLFVQILWSLWGISRFDEHDLEQGWLFYLYQFPLLNSIMMPVIVAVLASRMSDIEHKGETFRALETILSSGTLINAKLACGLIYLLVTVFFQVVAILFIGITVGFTGQIPFDAFALYFLFTVVIGLAIFLFQLILSMLIPNQMVSLAVGVMGSFIALFSLYFPQGVQKFYIWGYYGVMMFVGMDWDRATRITDFHWVPVDWAGFLLLLIHILVIYIIGRVLFAKKEMV